MAHTAYHSDKKSRISACSHSAHQERYRGLEIGALCLKPIDPEGYRLRAQPQGGGGARGQPAIITHTTLYIQHTCAEIIL